jgi:hypothetical protein
MDHPMMSLRKVVTRGFLRGCVYVLLVRFSPLGLYIDSNLLDTLGYE